MKFKKTINEAYQEVLEKLDPKKDDVGDYVKDFQKSDAPQFKGKSKEKIRKMAVAAYLDDKEKNEELDEAKEVMSRFRDDKLKKTVMNLAKQLGLKVKELPGGKVEVSGNARKVMDLTLSVQKDNVKIEGFVEETELDEDAKMAKQSDADLKSMMKKMRDAEKKDPKMPSTQFMIKRISKEMKKRGLKEETLAVEKLDKEDEPTVKKVVKMLKKASDAHAGQAKDLEKDLKDETDLEEFKNMIVTINDPRKRKKAIDDLVKKNFGIRKDVMNPSKFKVYGNDTDLNKYAKDLKNFYGATIKAEEFQIKEDGHEDVPSSIRMCRTITEDAQQIEQALSNMGDESLDTWWTNKLAVASSSLNKLRDYITNPVQEARKSKFNMDDDDEESANKHIVMQLRKNVDLKGQKVIEFEDGKKQKVPLAIAKKAVLHHAGLRKPDEKDAFQKKIAKSYKDLLSAIKGK